MRVSIFGLGYVGSVSAGCLAALGNEVIGVDINSLKVQQINDGQSPVVEKGLDSLIAHGVNDGKIRAVMQTAQAVDSSEISLICVGTPGDNRGRLRLNYALGVCREIGQALSNKKDYHVVALRSTMLPGSTEEVIIPALEKASGMRVGKDFGVAYSPEFLREGTAVRDFSEPPFKIIGQYDRRAAETIIELYKKVDAPLHTVPVKVAEMIKYASNAYHALKVVYANEIGNICKKYEIDGHSVMDIFCVDTKLNLSPCYLRPGFAFGGSCLSKDLQALIKAGQDMGLHLPLLESILPSNKMQIERAFEMIQQTDRKRVGILGLSFKAGTDDLRESPLIDLILTLTESGYNVLAYDPNLCFERLTGANKSFVEKVIPHLHTLARDSLEEVIEGSEVIVVGTREPEFRELFKKISQGQAIIDLVRITDPRSGAKGDYHGICW
jgi:GDP-mannose 6-dehydrogenase